MTELTKENRSITFDISKTVIDYILNEILIPELELMGVFEETGKRERERDEMEVDDGSSKRVKRE